MDANAKQEVAEKLRSSSSVLVTVSKNPSVDQLSSALGLSLMLTKLGKHTTTVFSGEIPNTMEFLDPERTFDKTVDGLRDFIISLDKDKADKLRYKVEDNVVKIYITPYKSKITQDDLEFSQGDFNVDLVVGLGVHERNDLDDAITSHGRILHDATIITINDGKKGGGNLGAVDWTNENASCLSEMLVSISEALEGGILDKQMSTAFLTGIVAATERFKNDLTTPKLMTMAAQLMAAGANQQLIASNLQFPSQDEGDKSGDDKSDDNKKQDDDKKGDDFAKEDSTMSIDRDKKDEKSPDQEEPEPPKSGEPEAKIAGPDDLLTEIEDAVQAKHNELGEDGRTKKMDEEDPAIQKLEDELSQDSSSNLIDLEGKLKSFDPNNVQQEDEEPVQDRGPIGQARSLDSSAVDPEDKPVMGGTFNATAEQAHDQLEVDRANSRNKTVLSHGPVDGAPNTHGRDLRPGGDVGGSDMPSSEELMRDLQEARRAVEDAMNDSAGSTNQPIQALNAAPIDIDDGGGDLNLSNNMSPLNQPMNPIGQGPAPMSQQQFQPPMPQQNGQMNMPMPQQQFQPSPAPMPQQQFQPPPQQQPMNPMFNLPPQGNVPPSNSPQFGTNPIGDMNGQMPQAGPPPMPPNAPPPMPPFN